MGEFLGGHKSILTRCGIEDFPERKGGRGRFLGRIRGEFPEENVVGDSRQSVGGFIIFLMKKNCLFNLIKMKES